MSLVRGTTTVVAVGLLLAPAYLSRRPMPGRPKPPAVYVEPVGTGVVVLTGPDSDIELREVPTAPDLIGPERAELAKYYPGLRGGMANISSSGLGTYSGTVRPPIHFATVVDLASGRRMWLFAQLASSEGFINRSALGWGGDHIPGVRSSGRMYDRELDEGRLDRITAVLHIALPGRSGVQFVFVGYNSQGERVPAFGRTPFPEYVQKRQSAK